MRGLKERGHEVTILTGKPNYPDGSFFSGYSFSSPIREDYEGVKVLRVPLVPRGSGIGGCWPEREEMPEGFRVVFAGNVGAAQSFETILAAAEKLKRYPGIHWVVFGDGRRRRWVEDRVRELRLEGHVHLLGRRLPESMPRYFALADALLVTLKRGLIFSLTTPAKVQSYLACGRPVVAALDGEGAHVIEEPGAGFAAPAEDAGSLAEAVLRLYETSLEEREEMGRQGRAYSEEHFEREKLLDQLEGWAEELVEGRS